MFNSINYKFEEIGVNFSSTFMAKSRCKKCGSHPATYYYTRNKYLWLDPNNALKANTVGLRKYLKRMCADHYLMIAPKYFTNLINFSHSTYYKGYLPKLHTSRGRNFRSSITEFLMCECGDTSWAFADKAVRGCPEIFNRKSRFKYPQKFEY
jgi:hypothetical protein